MEGRAEDEGRKDSESIIHKKDANHSLSTNSISLLCSCISTSSLSLLGLALLYSLPQLPAEFSLSLSLSV